MMNFEDDAKINGGEHCNKHVAEIAPQDFPIGDAFVESEDPGGGCRQLRRAK